MSPYIVPGLNTFDINVQLRLCRSSDQILFKVAEYFLNNGHIEIGKELETREVVSLIKGKLRKKEIVQARFAAAYFIHNIMGISLKSIGKILGGRDHSSIIHAKDKYEDNVSYYKEEQVHHLELCNLLITQNKIDFKR
tara:strand:+ start:2421 stop:2834 length:414 start_codon:yes stop_codon:yes gene_type:complete